MPTTNRWQPRATVSSLRRPCSGRLTPGAGQPRRHRRPRGPQSQGQGDSVLACPHPRTPRPQLRLAAWEQGRFQTRAGRDRRRACEDSGQRGVPGTLHTEGRGLEGAAGQYLSSLDPPLQVTRYAVHCGAASGLRQGCPTFNVAGARSQAPPRALGSPRPIRFCGKLSLTRPLPGPP